MAHQAGDLPPQVIAALEQGKKVEAVKLLRQATGLSLRDAMKLIESRIRAAGGTLRQNAPAAVQRLSPDEARQTAEALGAALKRGDWSDAIRHFGTLAGKDLGKASQTVENLSTKYKTLSGNFQQSGLSPGEVPRTPLWQIYLVVIALGFLLYYLIFGFK